LLDGLAIGQERLLLSLFFDPNAEILGRDQRGRVEALGAALGAAGPQLFQVKVSAFTDDVGTSAFNLSLAEARASAVRDAITIVLAAIEAPAPARIETVGFGEAFAVDKDSFPNAPILRAVERRVDIVVRRIAEIPPKTKETPFVLYVPPRQQSPHAPADGELFAFESDTKDLSVFVPDDRLALFPEGSIDFWLAPGWKIASPPRHDPVVLAIGDLDRSRLAILIARERDAIYLWNGTTDPPIAFNADLSDDRLHHVALSLEDGAATLYHDGLASRPLPFRMADVDPSMIHLGSLPGGTLAFVGKIGRIRAWGTSMDSVDVAAIAAIESPPGFGGSFFDGYLGGALPVAAPKRARFDAPDLTVIPAAPFFAPFGATDLGLANRASLDGSAVAPVIKPLMDPERDYRIDDVEAIVGEITEAFDCRQGLVCRSEAERIKIAETVVSGRLERDAARRSRLVDSASYPLVQVKRVDAADPANLALGGKRPGEDMVVAAFDDRADEIVVYADDVVRGLLVRRYPDVGSLPGAAPAIGRTQERNAQGNWVSSFSTARLDPDEDLLSVTGRRNGSRISQLSFHTTKQVYGPFGQSERGELFELTMPAGVPFRGFVAPGDDISRLGLRVDPDDLKPGMLITFEDGRSSRFVRISRNRYRGVVTELPLSGFRAAPIEAAMKDRPSKQPPELEFVTPDRIRISGLGRPLVAVADHAPPSRSTRFDDTFVSLSKAVNLQANYTGYDIVRMDPIHLTDTGVAGRIFAMPAGSSTDYHDENRIFVPNGLIYTPLFTGKANNHTTTSATLEKYKDSFTRTVGVNLAGRLAPARFSLSETVAQARSGFEEQTTVRTTGLSQIYFYALSVDKARISLSEAFRDSVAALADSGSYQAFIDAFGTHYPANVFYGGLGVLDMASETTSKGSGSVDTETLNLKAGLLLDAATESAVDLDYSSTTGREEEARETFGAETSNFFWVGGTHMGADRNSWSVGPDGAVPVHVDLKRIDELLVPFFFDDPKVTGQVRRELAAAVDLRLRRFAELEALLLPSPQHGFSVEVTGLRCTRGTENWDGLYIAPNMQAFRLEVVNRNGNPLSAAGKLAEGVLSTSKFFGERQNLGFSMTRGWPLDDLCDSDAHGTDFLPFVVPDKGNRKASFALLEEDIPRAKIRLASGVAGWTGYLGEPGYVSIKGAPEFSARAVLCRDSAKPVEDCDIALEGPVPRTISGLLRVHETGGPGILEVRYDLTYEGVQ
jgi:hypothetical protein